MNMWMIITHKPAQVSINVQFRSMLPPRGENDLLQNTERNQIMFSWREIKPDRNHTSVLFMGVSICIGFSSSIGFLKTSQIKEEPHHTVRFVCLLVVFQAEKMVHMYAPRPFSLIKSLRSLKFTMIMRKFTRDFTSLILFF